MSEDRHRQIGTNRPIGLFAGNPPGQHLGTLILPGIQVWLYLWAGFFKAYPVQKLAAPRVFKIKMQSIGVHSLIVRPEIRIIFPANRHNVGSLHLLAMALQMKPEIEFVFEILIDAAFRDAQFFDNPGDAGGLKITVGKFLQSDFEKSKLLPVRT